jgi:hypothetical protein
MINFNFSTFGEIASLSPTEYVERAKTAMAARFTKFVVTQEQLSAWDVGFAWLHEIATTVNDIARDWLALPEYAAPLVSGRPDLVILSKSHLLVVELKTGSTGMSSSGKKQVREYARTLWGKLKVARGRKVIAILLSPRGSDSFGSVDLVTNSFSEEVLNLSVKGLNQLIRQIAALEKGTMPPVADLIAELVYSPRPSVVEAATALVAATDDKNVITGLSSQDEIEHVATVIRRIAHHSRSQSEHTVVVVSGPPGAGKTLVGLRMAHDRAVQGLIGEENGSPLYLTGNGPLVEVLVESLARDEVRRRGVTKKVALASASSKVRLVHGITERSLGIDANIIIFDEGQRVWNAQRLRLKKGDPKLGSEAEEILAYMEAHTWSLVVVLLGEGQEINKGEEGLATWVEAIKARSETGPIDWNLVTPEPVAVTTGNHRFEVDPALRLKVVRRTDNAANVSSWASALLGNDLETARSIRADFPDFPIFMTRDFAGAKRWLLESVGDYGGSRGLLASSRSKRLFLYGLDVVAEANRTFSAANWYLNSLPDLTSAEALELAATEYKSQGLELDWVGLCWSWDMILQDGKWSPRELNCKSSTWRRTGANSRSYHMNAYRVLLTRARKGLIIWVPPGDPGNLSMLPQEMDEVAELLASSGVKEIPTATNA